MKLFSEKDKKRIIVLKRKQKVLEDNKNCLLLNLNPILEELEKIRIELDDIEFGFIKKG